MGPVKGMQSIAQTPAASPPARRIERKQRWKEEGAPFTCFLPAMVSASPALRSTSYYLGKDLF
jgi:hypothetical protein